MAREIPPRASSLNLSSQTPTQCRNKNKTLIAAALDDCGGGGGDDDDDDDHNDGDAVDLWEGGRPVV